MAYPQEKVDEALALVDTGTSHSEVGRLLKIPQVNISRWVRKRHSNHSDTPISLPENSTPEPTLASPVQQKIALSLLCVDAGTQMRESLNLATIADYAYAMSEGAKFPPVTVYSDGESYWLADGFQRVVAAEQVGYPDIAAEIRPGTLRDAMLFACGANATHGQRRSNKDKRKSVLTLLGDEEWSHWSDNHIAEVCCVSHTFVSEVRQSLTTINVASDDSNTRQYVDKHGNISTMDTSNIGKRESGERKTRPETQAPPSKVTQKDGWTFYEPPDKEPAAQVSPDFKVYDNKNDVHLETPSSCATCAAVVTLLDEASAQFEREGYLDVEQVLLTVRQLVTEKSAAHDA